MPLYRQEAVSERAGHLIVRSTLAPWVRQGDAAGRLGDDAAANEALEVQAQTGVAEPRVMQCEAESYLHLA